MRVLALSNLFPSPAEPTRGVFNRNTFLALAAHCAVRVVSPLPWWTRVKTPASLLTAPHAVIDGLPAIYPTYWTVPRVGHALHGRAMFRSLLPHVNRICRDFPFDAILAAWAYPDGEAAALLAKRFGCRLIVQVLGSDVNELAERPELRGRIRSTLNAADRVVTVSGALRDSVHALGVPCERIVVQYNGVDGEAFRIREQAEVRAQLGLPKDRPLIVYVGNLKPEKGVDVLIEAMGLLARQGADARLSIVGDGDEAAKLRVRVEALGIADRVAFHGRRLHNEIPNWIAAADVFCLPSRREGCPNVVIEALASGRPVVASAVGGVPELLAHDNGALVPSDEPGALALALLSTLERGWEPEALRATVPCLSWDRVGETFHKILNEIVPAPRRDRQTEAGAPPPK